MKIGIITLLALCSVALASKRCALKPNPGPCYGSFKRWSFDQKTQKCTSFIWGGCLGVVPFETETECEKACEDPCTQLPDAGPCEAAIDSWFFNQKTKKCEKFLWGGCDGSRPFATLGSCQKRCAAKTPCQTVPKDVLPPPGSVTCQAVFTSWYFNKGRGRCVSFTYSGCSNLGPFESEAACVQAGCKCELRPRDTSTGGGITCAAFWTTWFYNGGDGCDKLSYSGCSPIGFGSERECVGECVV